MLYSGTDPESYITEYTLVYEEENLAGSVIPGDRFRIQGWRVRMCHIATGR